MITKITKIGCWNCGGVYGSFVYVRSLLNSLDVLALSEHWLYHDELAFLDSLDDQFDVISCSSSKNNINERWRRGQGGVALFLKKSLKAQEVKTSCDRIVSASLVIENIKIVVVSVYLPSTNCTFSDYLNTLNELEQICIQHKSNGLNVVLLGDFNAHLQELHLHQSLNKRGLKLEEFCNALNLIPVNVSPVCKNPQYTYISRTGNSIVDYAIIEDTLMQFFDSVERACEHPDNTAFHLPLKLNLVFVQVSDPISNDTGNYSFNAYDKIPWKRCTVEQRNSYRENLNLLISDVLESKNLSDVDVFYEELTKIIKKADQILPRVKFKKHIKPFWSKKLKTLRKSVMAARIEWMKAGSPRQRSNISYIKYKKLKCEYRREQRKAVWEHERKEFSDIDNLQDLDNEKFWRLLNNKACRKNKKNKRMLLEVNGIPITDSQQMADLWANYFEKLATPSEDNENYDRVHQREIENEINDIIQNSQETVGCIFNAPLTTREISDVISNLPHGKAPGFDGITYEHLKYGGEKIIDVLLKLYTWIIDKEEIPNLFKLAVKIPILKGNKKSHTFDDHRGISLLSCINKVLERVVLQRLQKQQQCHHHPLQGGYQKEQDALTTCFAIEEVINHCCEDNDKVYVAYMDISKAFDTMWINGMLYKLYYKKGITGKAWRIIRNWYLNMREFVIVEGKLSRVYELGQGTRQGGVLSPWLFLVFIDDLIEKLSDIEAGVFINTAYFGSPMFADDLTMLSRVKSGLDKMLRCAWGYSNKWRFIFNATKTVILTFGESYLERSANHGIRNWQLGSQIVSEKESWTNLGKIWNINEKSSAFVSKATSRGREAGMVLMKMGARYGAINPTISVNLWKRVGIPKMLYGCELWKMNSHDTSELEKVQNITVRIMQGLLPGVSGSAARGLLGLLSIEAEMDKRKLYFLGRLVLMRYGIPCRRIFLVRLIRWKWNRTRTLKGFLPDIVRILQKYKLMDFLTEYVLSDYFPRKSSWKELVKKYIHEHYNNIWQEKINKHGQLKIYGEVHPVNEVSQWWLLAKTNPQHLKQIGDVARLLCGSYKVKGKRVNKPETYSDYCDMCCRNYLNPINHALLYCNGSSQPREELWGCIHDIMPVEMAVHLASLTDTQFILVILGKQPEMFREIMGTWTQLLLKFASYVSFCCRNTLFSN